MKSVVSIVETFRLMFKVVSLLKPLKILKWELKLLVPTLCLLFLGGNSGCNFKSTSSQKLGLDARAESTRIVKDSQVAWQIYGEIPHMSPYYSTDVKVWGLQSLVWDPFITLDKKGLWQPHLVRHWAFNKDLSAVDLKITPDLKWSDGTEVTEEDFRFSFEFYKYDALNAKHWQSVFEKVKSVELKDKNTLRVTLYEASGFETWNQILSMARLLPSSSLNSETSRSALHHVKNTGPYSVVNFSSTKAWALKRNPHSWWAKDKLNAAPETIWVQKVLSENLVRDGFSQKKFAAYVDYGQLNIHAESHQPVYRQDMAKNLVLNLSDKDLKQEDLRRCLFLTLPSVEQMQRLNIKNVDFVWRKKQEAYLLAKNHTAKGATSASSSSSSSSSSSATETTTTTTATDCGASALKGLKLKVHYILDTDRRWLEFWQENAKQWGLVLELKSVGASKLAGLLKDKNYQIIVSESILDHLDQWPLTVFHSEGSYNHQSWQDPKLDSWLKEKSMLAEFAKKQELNHKITQHIMQSFGMFYLYDFNRPMAWVQKPCDTDDEFLWWQLLRCSSVLLKHKETL